LKVKQLEYKAIILLEHVAHNSIFGKPIAKLHKWQHTFVKIQEYLFVMMMLTAVGIKIDIKDNVIWMELV
jgi:hypothetical protein